MLSLPGSFGLSISEQRAGLRVSALRPENAVDTAMVIANCLYISPVIPPINAVGTNTARSTSTVPMIGPVISSIAFIVASYGDNPPSSICRAVFSTTRIASSTTIPIARIRPNSVRVLIENPITPITANVPIRDTGMVMAGISVERKS